MRHNRISFICGLVGLLGIISFISCTNIFKGVGSEQDITPPVFSISSPGNSDFVSIPFEMSGTAKDNKALMNITVQIVGSNYEVTQTATTDWALQIAPTGLADGDYKLKVIVTDKANNSTETFINLSFDTAGPEISIYSPEIDADPVVPVILQGRNSFVVAANDMIGVAMDSPNNRLVIRDKNDPDTMVFSQVFSNNGTSAVWDTILFDTMDESLVFDELSSYEMVISFEDNLGNISRVTRNTVLSKELDNPLIYIESPNPSVGAVNDVSKWLTISGYAVDNRAVARVGYNIKRTNGTFVYGSSRFITPDSPRSYFNYNVTVETDNLPDDGGSLSTGSYWVVLYAIDDIGNISNIKEAKFTIDTTVPIIRVLDSLSSIVGDTPISGTYLGKVFNTEIECTTPELDSLQYKVTQQDGAALHDTGWDPFGALTKNADKYSGSIDPIALKTTHSFKDGLITVSWRAVKGAKESTVSRVFYIDTTLPTISMLSHADNQSVNGAVIISGSAYDAMGLEGSIKIYVPSPIDATFDATGTNIWSYIAGTDESLIETRMGIANDSFATKTYRITAYDKAGNSKSLEIPLIVDPREDIPRISLLLPEADGQRVSGVLSVLAIMEDDDYPAKNMTANLRVYKMPEDLVVSSLNKNYTTSSPGFPNISTSIDTMSLLNNTRYRIRINGEDWHGKVAEEVVCDFIVDQDVPLITLSQPADQEFRTTQVRFAGTVKDNNQLSGLTLSYLHSDGENRNVSITLSQATPFVEGNYNYTFDCTVNSANGGIGFVSGDGIDWGNDEWGNTPHLFALRASDLTGLIGYKYVTINLDNKTPTITLTTPAEGHIITGGTVDIKGGVNDSPPQGVSYPIGLAQIKIDLYKGGVYNRTIKDYGVTAGITGTSASFTYNWTVDLDLSDANDYSLRAFAKDSSLHESSPSIVNISKNSNPPVINSIVVGEIKNYYRGNIQFNVAAQDTGELPANGVKTLELLVEGVVQGGYTKDWTGSEPLSVNSTFIFDTVAYGTDGIKEISFRVTDKDGTTFTKSAGVFAFDNGQPVINTPILYTQGYDLAITEYSTYLGFTVKVTDGYSLVGDLPQFKLGRTSGGNQILDWTDLVISGPSWVGEKEYAASYPTDIDLSDETGTIYITIKSTDNAGNEQTSTFSINRSGSIPTIALDGDENSYKSDYLDTTVGDGYTEISGTVSVSGQDKVWVRVGTGAEVEVSNYSGGTTLFHKFANNLLVNGLNTFRLRVSRNGIQKIITRSFFVDNSKPVVIINSTYSPKSSEGFVSTNNLSGKVIITGTYEDNNQNNTSKSDAAIGININGSGWVNIPNDRIIQLPYPEKWTWSYEWDSQTLSTVVGNNINIVVDAKDKANNPPATGSTLTRTVNVVPYISSLSSNNPSTNPVMPVRWYQDEVWDNHGNRRYSLAHGTQLIINGYNLKQGANAPVINISGQTPSIVSSAIGSVRVDIPTGNDDYKTGDLTITVGGSASTAVSLRMYKIARIGNSYDTFNAKSFDMNMTDDNMAFVTFTRDHRVDLYNNVQDDYCTYRITEAATYNPATANAYNNFGRVDPMFYTANVVYGNWTYMASCQDEWGNFAVGNFNILKRTTLTDETKYSEWDGWSSSGLTKPSNSNNNFNTIKNGSIALRNAGSGNGNIYVTQYNDDSRAGSPVPKLHMWILTLAGYETVTESRFYQIADTGTPGPWNSTALKTTDSGPIISYYSLSDGVLRVAFNAASDDTPASLDITRTADDGGKYNSIAVGTGNLIMASYQSPNQDLKFGTFNGLTDTTFQSITLESGDTYGLSGFSTSIALDTSGKPNISFINNSKLNTNEALRIAMFTGSSPTEAEMMNAANWEIIVVPSPVSVNFERTVTRWNNNTTVTAYRGNNYIYIARQVN